MMSVLLFSALLLVVVSVAEIIISFDEMNRLMHVEGVTIILVDSHDSMNAHLNISFDERVEDRVDSFTREISAKFLPNPLLSHALTEYICAESFSFPHDMMGCDGQPARLVIGVVHVRPRSFHFIREGDSLEGFFLSYESRHQNRRRDGFSPLRDSIDRTYNLFRYFHTVQHMHASVVASSFDDSTAIAISLGTDCFSAQMGVGLGLRPTRAEGYLTGPFDLMTSNYEGVIKCLKDNFRYFTDSRYLDVVKLTDDIQLDDYSVHKRGDHFIRNTYYNFFFNHESPLLTTQSAKWRYVDNDFQLFKDRYNRRISNFREYIASNQSVVFSLTVLSSRETGSIDTPFRQLEETIRSVYPELVFRLQWLLRLPLQLEYEAIHNHSSAVRADVVRDVEWL
jgi:hypothetical protein